MDLRLAIADSVQLNKIDGGRWSLSHSTATSVFSPSEAMSSVLTELVEQGLPVCRLEQLVESGRDTSSLVTGLKRLWTAGVLVQIVRAENEVIAALRGCGNTRFLHSPIEESRCVVLTENVLVRRRGNSLVMETAEAGATVELKNAKLFQLAALLMNPVDCQELAKSIDYPAEVLRPIVTWLVNIQAASPLEQCCNCEGGLGWSFADRLFHARSRLGRHIGGYGATFPLREKIPVPPASVPSNPARSVALYAPDLEKRREQDPSFTTVLEDRRSVREYDSRPINACELGEFLYRTARVKDSFRLGGVDFISRPYPSGGSLHELEFYVLAQNCEEIKPAVYRYDGVKHFLEHVSALTSDAQRILRDASRSAPLQGEIQVLIVLAARFLRVNWKYESMAYALILKHVGVALQTMYLVATAMGLGACALGGGDSVCFSNVVRRSYWNESSVGEILLGRPRASEPYTKSKKHHPQSYVFASETHKEDVDCEHSDSSS